MKKIIMVFFALHIVLQLNAQVPDSWSEKNGIGLNVPAGAFMTPRMGAVSFSIGTKGYIGTGNDYTGGYRNDFWEYDPVADTWTQKANCGTIGRAFAAGFSIGTKGYIGTGLAPASSSDFWEYDPAANTWTQKTSFAGGVRSQPVGFSISGKGYLGTGYGAGLYRKDLWEYDPATNGWTQKADLIGVARTQAVGFSIGTKGYIGTGNTGTNLLNDFWEYNPSTNAWVQKANFGGVARSIATGFGIGSKGYIGTGSDNTNPLSDFWEYDPSTNLWAQKQNFGGAGRTNATGFSIGTKGYLGTGITSFPFNDLWEFSQSSNTWTLKTNTNSTARSNATGFCIGAKGYMGTGIGYDGSYKNDFWEYDISSGAWTQKANFGGTARKGAVGFSIGTKGYIGTGENSGTLYNDFWEYDPALNSWIQKANFTGTARSYAAGFNIGSKGYIGTGSLANNNFYEYNPATNLWTAKASFAGTARIAATGFSIGSKGYIGTGQISGGTLVNDFWEYDPAANTWTQKATLTGAARSYATGFSVGSKGYIGTGYIAISPTYTNDLWEYDPATNQWTQRANVGASGRNAAVSFASTTKGYIGTGFQSGFKKNDFWEYNLPGPTQIDQGMYFESDDQVTVNSNPAYNFGTGNFTYEAVIKYDSVGISVRHIFFNNSSANDAFQLSVDQGGIGYEIGTHGFGSTVVIGAGICHHIALTRSSSTVTIYVDGALYFTLTHSLNAIPAVNTGGFKIGHFFGGVIREARIWNVARTQSELQTYNGIFLTGNEPNLVGYWRLNDGNSQIIDDLSTVNNNGYKGASVNTDSQDPVPIFTCNINTCTSLPAAVITPAGSTTFCTGNSLTLNANAGTGLTYQWKLNGSNISGASSISYSASQSGNYSVAVTNSSGCSAVSPMITLTVLPPTSAITNPVGYNYTYSFCSGSSYPVTAGSGPGYTYQWQLNGFNINGATSQAYTVTSTGDYTVVVTNMCGQSTSPVLHMNANTPLSPVITQTAGNPLTTLSVSQSAGAFYQWYESQNLPQNLMYAQHFSNLLVGHSGYFMCEVTNACGTYLTSPELVITSPAGTIYPDGIPASYAYVCPAGDSVKLVNVDSNSFTSWVWIKDGLVVSPVNGPAYYAKQPGNYTCLLYGFGYPGVVSNIITVLSLAAPVAAISPPGPVSICSGQSVLLNSGTGTGYTFQWKKNGTNISGATNQNYTAGTTGSYTVVITNTCGSATSSAVSVTVNSLPSATITPADPTTFCSGDSVQLNAPVNANYSYQWKKNNANISGATLSSYTTTSGGNYKVIVTNTVTGCSKTTASATVVTVNALPTATITPQGATSFCAGGSVVLAANTGAGLTYKWKKGSSFISGATLSNYTSTTAGNYRVQVTNSNGCSKVSGLVAVSVPCKEGESVNAGEGESVFDVNVYPNPNSGEFTIKFSNKLISSIQIELTDAIGKVVKRFETDDETIVIKETNLAKGIYCLTVRNKDEMVIKKISVVK